MQKLKLNKEVIATLTNDSMRRVEGGAADTFTVTCTCGGTTCTNTNQCTGQYCYTHADCNRQAEDNGKVDNV